MKKHLFFLTVVLLCSSITFAAAKNVNQKEKSTLPASSSNLQRPDVEGRVHVIGTLWNTVTNHGQYGNADQITPSME